MVVPSGIHRDIYLPFLRRLKSLYAIMDQQYRELADSYGFVCRGCEDNCCLTRFYHHTFLEYYYLFEGYCSLATDKRSAFTERARKVCRQMEAANQNEEVMKAMCPLNEAGLCFLYAHRPMICRLHGIPHEFQKPGQRVVSGAGCEAFTHQCQEYGYIPFDRTPFYMEMAGLEKELKRVLGTTQKIKMTIAEMITTF
ncbi:hypothetical protein ACFL9U_00540 [Thermodesulfobacteriota bacterium]